MKSSKFVAAFVALSMVAAGALFAADKAVSKPGGCCTKAAKDGKTCAHPCCVESAKAGNNCTKCGGAGKIKSDKK